MITTLDNQDLQLNIAWNSSYFNLQYYSFMFQIIFLMD